ncbi:hypothetical protein NSQ91_31925 [Paenibacillus sp. FSL R7-0048]|uniref:hypothetical protein n=1 Tax=Paenibacillus sp. FSL R7-0048 TaxID=2954528 RepID=UPI0030F857BD
MSKNEFIEASMRYIREQCEQFPEEIKISLRMQNYITRSIEGAWDCGKMEVLERIVER